MSAEQIVRIKCDGEKVGVPWVDCPDARRVVECHTLIVARASLKRQGWVQRHAMVQGDHVILDLCPSCDARAKIVPAPNSGGRPPKVRPAWRHKSEDKGVE